MLFLPAAHSTFGMEIMKLGKIVIFHLLGILISITVTVGALLLILKVYDVYLLSHRQAALADEDADEPTMRTLEYYPFTGGHVQAYKTERGRQPWTSFYDDFDVVSGEYGFFIDFRLESPPAKKDNEIRIVLAGGSTAQGWGGQTNADMFYKLLPVRLTQRLQEQGGNCPVTLVNLAMGSSHIYQSFIALNKWAHSLHPDAIVSFSGNNELAVPSLTKSDADFLGSEPGALLHVLRYSASPPWLKKLARFYPGIVRRTLLGSMVRLFYLSEYNEDWAANYYLSRTDEAFGPMPNADARRRYEAAIKGLTNAEIVDSVSIPLYVQSLESISRDFAGMPIFAVFQPVGGVSEEYARMSVAIPRQVNDEDHYDDVKFLDLRRVWQEHGFFPGSLVDGLHLSNEGHVLVTDYLSDYLFPFVQDRCKRLTAAKAAPPRPVN
jgi:hypothetical protein